MVAREKALTEWSYTMAKFMVLVKKAMQKIEVESDNVPEGLYAQIFAKGLEEVINLKMSKFKLSPKALKELENGSDADKAEAAKEKAAAFAKAEENLKEIYAGTFKLGRAGATDASGAKISRDVNTEAMRVARGHVKDWLRSQKIPFSHVPAAKITEAAKQMLAQNPQIIEDAKATVAARAAKAPAMPAIDIQGMVSPELVKKVSARNADRKAKSKDATEKVLSAAQAGKVKPRPQQTAH